LAFSSFSSLLPSSISSLLVYFLSLSSFSFSFIFPILIFPALASTASYTLLDTLSFLLPLFSNQFQNCGM